MKAKKTTLYQSPIAHRIFVLFLISSALPLCLLIFLIWVVATGETFHYVFNYFAHIKIRLLLLMLAYVGILLFLCIKQIRYVLIPLQKLRAVTREIANQNFNTKVFIRTNDEFEELAHSFNRMSNRLGKQFNTLETMARIDRLILSTLDIDSIVETILVRMKHIISCDTATIMILNEKMHQEARFYFRKDPLSTRISYTEVEFTAEDKDLLLNNPDYVLIESNGLSPRFLQPIRLEYLAFLLLPIFIQGHLNAVIALGYRSIPKHTSDDINNARDLAHRVAVALSNAAWEHKLYHQAHHDNLTNLPNRLLFQDRLKQALTRSARDSTLVALLFIDLDRFKSVNDSLGHETGDLLLIEVANRLRKQVRNIDTVSRLGGDEFTIIIPDLHNSEDYKADISAIVKKILTAINAPYNIKGQELNFTCSVGVSLFPKDADNFLDLLRNADSAMFFAKTKGKNNHQFYAENINAEAKSMLVLENQLHHAVEKGEFKLFYQPIINLKTGRVVSAEALIRWQHPEKGMLYPSEFITLAEENGLILTIGEWVLRTACHTLKKWHLQGFIELKMSANLSVLQFADDKITKLVEEILKEAKLAPQFLELEITESTLMLNLEQAFNTLEKFKQMGVSIALDDFGTGYSSLNYLKKLPVDALKIDQSFIRDLVNSNDNKAIVSAILTLSRHLDITVIAEGVETEEELNFLKEAECNEAQGYIYSPPLSEEQFIAFMQTFNSSLKNIESETT